LISNVEDLYKWHQALYNYILLKKETLDKAFTTFKLLDGTPTNYGYGWFIIDMNGSQSIQHGGNINGFKSNEIYFPKENVFLVTLFNCECAPMEDLSFQIANLSIGKVPEEKGITLGDTILISYIGKYINPSDPNRPITISKENNRLYAGINNEWKAELVALSEVRFNLKNIRPSGVIDFVKASNQKVTKLIVTQSSKPFEFIKSD
jgi:hypothetical protein